MAIEIKRPDAQRIVYPSDMMVGKLYYISDNSEGTLYTRTLSDDIIWFEDSRVSILIGASKVQHCKYRFVEAPKGTEVTIKN